MPPPTMRRGILPDRATTSSEADFVHDEIYCRNLSRSALELRLGATPARMWDLTLERFGERWSLVGRTRPGRPSKKNVATTQHKGRPWRAQGDDRRHAFDRQPRCRGWTTGLEALLRP